MLDAIDEGYSLILFPEGTRARTNGKNKVGITRILSLRPELKYIPVFMTRHGTFTPQGRINLIALQGIRLYGTPAVAGHRRS